MSKRKSERGHLLIGVLATVAIMLILATVATQAWVEVVRRDNEAEMIFRAEEIVRAIYRFQRDQGRLPLSLDELMEPGQKGQYFLRRPYDDPLTRDGKWGLLHATPGGGIYDPASPESATTPGLGGTQPGLGGGQSGIGGNQPGGSGNRPGQSKGFPSTSTGQPGSSSPFGGSGQSEEGLPIIGVRTLADDTPFRNFRGSQDYAQWLFTVYDLQRPGQGQPGQGNQPGQQPGGGTQQGGLPGQPNN